ncbi:hypothetical protein BT93_I0414 [Corymbia citriodora subsp. variegata]|nr:hypothetical protein BT93_I0414 [Corymbia citriodora subsp. variegata]
MVFIHFTLLRGIEFKRKRPVCKTVCRLRFAPNFQALIELSSTVFFTSPYSWSSLLKFFSPFHWTFSSIVYFLFVKSAAYSSILLCFVRVSPLFFAESPNFLFLHWRQSQVLAQEFDVISHFVELSPLACTLLLF